MDDRSSTSRADLHVHSEASQESRRRAAVAVAIRDVAPATFAQTALIRDWLDDHGIDRVTLLVARDPELHPLSTSSPELAEWLLERAELGDEIAWQGLARCETGFAGPGQPEARHTVRSGAGLMRPAGVSLLGGPLLRIDLRPSDLAHTRRMLALEHVLRRARRRTPVTYDDVAALRFS
jgi:hypothetical protein